MLLSAVEVRSALETTAHPIRLINESGGLISFTDDPVEVLALLAAGIHQFGGTRKRVKWIKLSGAQARNDVVDPLKGIIDDRGDQHWRAHSTPVLPPWPQYRDGVFGLRVGQGRLIETAGTK